MAVVAHPNKKTVLPVAAEPIIKQANASKNDCEINAAKRILPQIRQIYPNQKITIVADGIYSKGPFIKLLEELEFDYILVAKEKDHAHLISSYIERGVGGETEENETTTVNGKVQGFCWTDGLELNATHPDIKVNLLNFWEINPKKEKPNTWIWITNIKLTRQTVEPIMRLGRCRRKVENETFNTLKNQGYNLEHNYGHGKQHLATVFAILMFLMFLVDQIQEACCPLFQAARNRLHSRTSLWEKLRGFFANSLKASWEDIW